MSYADFERALADPDRAQRERKEREELRKKADEMRLLEDSIIDWVQNEADPSELEALFALIESQMKAREAVT